MKTMKALAVDDEPLALDVIETYLEKIPEINLAGKCANALEANQFLKTNDVDLLFLDIEMPQLSGLEFIKTLQNPPMVIFTTAYSKFAVEGFEVNALDYLVKPIAFDRFLKAANKAIDRFSSQQYEAQDSQGDIDMQHGGESNFIYVKADKKLSKIKYDEIYYIEGLKDYVIIKREQDRIVTLQTMKSLDEKLPDHLFQRIHRSYIIALDKIDAVVGNMVEMTIKGDKKSLPIGKNYKEDLLEIINQNRL